MKAEIASIVLQTAGAGRYTGPLVAGRYQVMGDFISSSYYVVDHHKADLLVRVAGPVSDIKRFTSVEDANLWINQCTKGAVNVIDQSVQPQETEMPKQPRVVTETPGWPVEAKRGGAKAKAPPDNITKVSAADLKAAKAAAKAKTAGMTTAPTNGAAKRGRAVSTKGTIASTIRNLIQAGKLTDDKILAKASEIHGKKIPGNAVAHYRADLVARGQL